MLSAVLDGQPILLHEATWDSQEESLREAARSGRLITPCCRRPVVLRWGLRRVRHFAHQPRIHCPYQRWSEPESAEHIAGKLLLYDWVRRSLGEQVDLLALEHPLPETLQRPDVFVRLKDGSCFALEYQRSRISLKEWTERHEAYGGLGVTDVWILGENLLDGAQPSEEQQARWGASEPDMLFLDLPAFANAASVRTPYEVAWWRGDRQEELWREQELSARTGREVSPWYRRSALERLRSLTFLDATSGELHIYRAMRELRGHVDTRMASVRLTVPLSSADLELDSDGFFTAADEERLQGFEARARRLEAAVARQVPATASVAETPAHYGDPRERLLVTLGINSPAFRQNEQEEEQRRRLQERAADPTWRALVDRLHLTPENLFFLVGMPIPDDTVIKTHRTVWQAFVFYQLVAWRRSGSFTTSWVCRHLEQRFGFDSDMVRIARYVAPGRLNSPEDVVGTFLNLLVQTGYLRNDQGSQHFRYYFIESPAPLAFMDRRQRHDAWAGLRSGQLRLDGSDLVGEQKRIPLVWTR